MSKENYAKAAKLIESYPSLTGFVGPRIPSLVEHAERFLGIAFPGTYRDFLLDYGAGNFGSTEIYGLIDDNFVDSGIPDAIWYTMKLRKDFQLPNHILVIYEVGDGEMVGINFASENKPESPVIAFTLEGILDNQFEEVAVDFGDFFLEMVNLQIKSQRNNIE